MLRDCIKFYKIPVYLDSGVTEIGGADKVGNLKTAIPAANAPALKIWRLFLFVIQ